MSTSANKNYFRLLFFLESCFSVFTFWRESPATTSTYMCIYANSLCSSYILCMQVSVLLACLLLPTKHKHVTQHQASCTSEFVCGVSLKWTSFSGQLTSNCLLKGPIEALSDKIAATDGQATQHNSLKML